MNDTTSPRPPRAATHPIERIVHGHRLEDPYAWLRADNWQDAMRDPSVLATDIRAYLEAENAYANAVLASTQTLQDTLFEEMKGRIKQDDSSVPAPDGAYAYAKRYVTGGEHPKFVRTPRHGGPQTVLLDGDAEAAGKSYFRLGGVTHSPDHRWLAWAYDDRGSEFYTVKIRDTKTGADLPGTIPDTSGGGVWSADGAYLFYVRLDANHRPSRVFRHRRGTDPQKDVLVYEEDDPGFFVTIGQTQSRRFLLIHIHDHQTSETWILPAKQPTDAFVCLAPRRTTVEYDVEHVGDTFVILTNDSGAEDFKIVVAPTAMAGAPDFHLRWRDLVPHRAGRLILSHMAFAQHLVRLEREDGLPRVVVRRIVDGAEHSISFDDAAYALGLVGGYEFETTTLRFTYSSMRMPGQVFDYDMDSRKRVLRKQQEVPSGHDPDAYVTERVHAPAPDGETVPISLLRRRDTLQDDRAPCLLYGYGAYGITIPAAFSTNVLSLVERGFVFAIAHVRGGKDKGFRWYAHGRREHKPNTFSDFIAAADHLIATGITASDRLVAQGGSAGGMLMGAVANQAPDRFAGIIAEVPFVDVLNTMLDDTLPLTPPEWPEWGNPIDDESAFRLIASYAPYDNVRPQAYPAILALAGLTDPRVTYWEPAKWIARLRATRTNDAPLLLKTNMDAGHAGAAGRFDRLKEVATIYAFALIVADREAEKRLEEFSVRRLAPDSSYSAA